MFEEIKKRFRKLKSSNLEEIKIPQYVGHLIRNLSIDIDTLERDNLNNLFLGKKTKC